ncbi:MAG: hypothetical protein GWN81_24875, partial [Phycisphaerae bacterium]|nr:hypothetical protein [Phycisphaerae bacterium]NIU12007.1 hypothetical protein [Phycisphaerae bacterium]NIW11428.1 hypothetical protein [Gammaproteobacteria bacterium]NIX32047.1 hypothetical protein [Phycisphaerae bacterium]
YKFAVEIKFLWFASIAKLAWISAHLKRGEPKDLDIAKEMLAEALAEFEEIGADGFVEFLAEKRNSIK